MKIAQVVITKTQNGKWKITAMSLNRVEKTDSSIDEADMLDMVALWMMDCEWEQLTLDV